MKKRILHRNRITKTISFVFSILLAVFCFGASASAQETTGNIEGEVKDPNGAVVPNITVTVEGIERGFSRTATTDENGFYRVPQVPPGLYRVKTAASSGFAAQTSAEVRVSLGGTTKVDFALVAGGAQATVDVIANAEVIDPTANRIQNNLTGRELELLPKGTNFASTLRAVPAVRPEPAAAGFQVDGASGSENTFIVDGQEVTNFRTGTLNVNNDISLEFVQEVQVKTSGFEAEFGGATGGVVNVVTRGGNNEFHGGASLQFEPSRLQAGPRPINTANTSFLEYVYPRRDEGMAFFPGINLSGPIIKQKLWFLANYSPQFFDTTRNFTFSNGETRSYQTKTTQQYGFLRLDAAPTEKLNLTSSFTWNPRRVRGALPGFVALNAVRSDPASAPTVEEQAALGGSQPSNIFAVSGTYLFTDKIIGSARFGRTYLNEKLASEGIPNVTRFRCITSGPAGTCSAGFASPAAANFATIKDISTRKTFDADLSVLVPNFGGRHQFKGGVQLNDVFNDVEEGYVNTGEIRLFYGRTFTDRNGNTFGNGPGEIGYGYLQRFGTVGKAGSRNLALYFQDQWQPFTGLTLNLGIRAEQENVPSFSENGQAIKFDFADKIAPRLGFAYDVGGKGKFKIFASFGQFYDRFKYELPRGSFGGDIYLRDYFPILASNPNPFFYTREHALNPANNRNQLNFRVPSNDPNDLRVDPNLKAVRQTEYTAGFQYQIFRNSVLGARYTHKQIDRTIEDIGYHIAKTIPGTTQTQGSEAYYIGNPGYGICARIACGVYGSDLPIPKAQRDYDALEITFSKRLSANYSFDASYTLSRLYGNYGGLASSDEFIVNGAARSSPNVNRVFDQPFAGFIVGGEQDNGRLPTDRPHVFKFAGTYTFDWKNFFGKSLNNSGNHSTNFSMFFTAQSGTPLTTRVDIVDVAYIPLYGRGDMGRTPVFTQTDGFISHRYRFGQDGRFALVGELNVLNLFNQATVLARQELITTGNFSPADFGIPTGAANPNDPTGRRTLDVRFFDGTTITAEKILALIRSNPNFAQDPNYNQPVLYQAPRSVRFGFRFIF